MRPACVSDCPPILQCLLPILQAILAGGALHADDQIQTHVDEAFAAVWRWFEFDARRTYPAAVAAAASAAPLNVSDTALVTLISPPHATVRALWTQRSATLARLNAWRAQRWLLRYAWIKTARVTPSATAEEGALELVSSVHWRYQLMSAVAIHALSRAALPVTSALTTFWTRVLVWSDSLPLRGCAAAALTVLMTCDRMVDGAVDSAAVTQLRELDGAARGELLGAMARVVGGTQIDGGAPSWMSTVFADHSAATGAAQRLIVTCAAECTENSVTTSFANTGSASPTVGWSPAALARVRECLADARCIDRILAHRCVCGANAAT